ncbi:uncharacterized protein LOC114580390 [Dendrobium catenatum]|uniref:uncharacterized protein LOC114580390 n=1 Tax=Dendrobium catenatum TaxID=906689 RepID=UPI0010A0A395|nr:uncharacterized protein LOC114580390 [Dendrobium catenatum]
MLFMWSFCWNCGIVWLADKAANPLNILFYIVFVLSACSLFSKAWIEVSGSLIRDVTKQFKARWLLLAARMDSQLWTRLCKHMDLDRANETFEAIAEKIGLTLDIHSYNALTCAFGKVKKTSQACKVDAGFTPSKEMLKKVRRRCSRELDAIVMSGYNLLFINSVI